VFNAEKKLTDLLSVTSCPVMPEAVAGCKSFGDWILMPLLCRSEAAPLRMLAGANVPGTYAGGDAPWQVFVHQAEDFREVSVQGAETGEQMKTGDDFDPSVLEFVYPWQQETTLPAKLTATQLKGREADSEIAEDAAVKPHLRPLTQPRFRQRAGLTAAETGTATHLVLQYLDFEDNDVAGQIARLKERRLLTEEQADAVMGGRAGTLSALAAGGGTAACGKDLARVPFYAADGRIGIRSCCCFRRFHPFTGDRGLLLRPRRTDL
jgi:ATP-dependent helicase/nuclease subunit A